MSGDLNFGMPTLGSVVMVVPSALTVPAPATRQSLGASDGSAVSPVAAIVSLTETVTYMSAALRVELSSISTTCSPRRGIEHPEVSAPGDAVTNICVLQPALKRTLE
jgi:hypothetical protein